MTTFKSLCCACCQQKSQNRKALPCHINHPFVACYSHFKEVADLANELEIYKNRRTRNENANNVQLTDSGSEMDVDATFIEHDDLGGGMIGEWMMNYY